MPKNPLTLPFPPLADIAHPGLRLRPGARITLELATDALPHFFEVTVHFAASPTDSVACSFITGLHPFYVLGEKYQDDALLIALAEQKASAQARVAKLASPRFRLVIGQLGYALDMRLLAGDKELQAIREPFACISRCLERDPHVALPRPRASAVRAKTPAAVNADAEAIFRGPKTKQRKAG